MNNIITYNGIQYEISDKIAVPGDLMMTKLGNVIEVKSEDHINTLVKLAGAKVITAITSNAKIVNFNSNINYSEIADDYEEHRVCAKCGVEKYLHENSCEDNINAKKLLEISAEYEVRINELQAEVKRLKREKDSDKALYDSNIGQLHNEINKHKKSLLKIYEENVELQSRITHMKVMHESETNLLKKVLHETLYPSK